ncbi:hypothetical protein F5H01DRAFT_385451 [Linnemannia elongata]|nr:hypothetical protein F5H01DRAFT_385451 [Linnemannia elongata]
MQSKQDNIPSFWINTAATARLQRDQCIAVALLVTGDHSKLDPTTGDAGCQVRAVIILILYYRLRRTFGETEWSAAVLLSKEYLLKVHPWVVDGGDEFDKRHTKDEIQGAPSHSYRQFNALVIRIRKKVGEHLFELLGLAYSLWSGGIVSTDEFWIDFRYRSNNLWGCHEFRVLRARLAKLSCHSMIELAAELPASRKWVEMLHYTKAVIKSGPVDSEEDVEVLCTQVSFSVALALLYHHNIPILDGNIRIQLHVRDDRDRDRDQDQDLHLRFDHLHLMEGDDASDKTTLGDTTYSFGIARALLYLPNETTGTFEHVKNPSEQQMLAPCFFLKSWSTYHDHRSTADGESSEDDDLYSADHDRYYEALAKMDKPWAIEVMASSHPPYTRRAKHTDVDIALVYERIFADEPPRAHKELRFNRYRLEGLTLSTLEASQQHRRPTLAERQVCARRVAHVRGLKGESQFVRMSAPSKECTWRTTQRMDWQVVHVYAATYEWVHDQLQLLTARHAKASGAIIGRYVFALGAVGASHESKETATKLHNTKNEKSRRNKYLSEYPHNQPLLHR